MHTRRPIPAKIIIIPGRQEPRKKRGFRGFLKSIPVSLQIILPLIGVIIGALIPGFLQVQSAKQEWPFPSPPTDVKLAALYDDKNPETECAAAPDDHVTTPNLGVIVVPGTEDLVATVLVRHSTTCDTTWLRVVSNVDNVMVAMKIDRAKSDTLPATSLTTTEALTTALPDTAIAFSNQLYSPDCDLISVRVVATDLAGNELGSFALKDAC